MGDRRHSYLSVLIVCDLQLFSLVYSLHLDLLETAPQSALQSVSTCNQRRRLADGGEEERNTNKMKKKTQDQILAFAPVRTLRTHWNSRRQEPVVIPPVPKFSEFCQKGARTKVTALGWRTRVLRPLDSLP